MAAVGRNEPCPCGSGKKAKRCCGVRRGPSDDQLARSELAALARAAAPTLVHRSEDELEVLFDEMLDTVQADLSLLVPLPRLLTPELVGLCDAVATDDPEAAKGLFEAARDQVDTPTTRARLARNVLDAGERGLVKTELAAAAVVDLSSSSCAFIGSSLLESAALASGRVTTPSGLVLAESY